MFVFTRYGYAFARLLLGASKKLVRAFFYLQKYGLLATVRRVKGIYSTRPSEHQTFDLRSAEKISILTTKHCLFVAELIKNTLKQTGLDTEILFEPPQGGFGKHPHVVLSPQSFAILPTTYVAFQMEQSIHSRWFTAAYFSMLKKAYAVFDYSLTNIAFLQKKGIPFKNIYYLPLHILPLDEQTVDTKDIDVLFYGDTNCERRKKMLAHLQGAYPIKIHTHSFCESMREALRKAKIVINIHYYEGALLETTRIYECLSQDCIVLSESSVDRDQHTNLEGIVDFVPIGDIEALSARIAYWLEDETRLQMKRLANRTALAQQPNRFDFYFLRFLLASGNIDFATFYTLAHKQIPFVKNTVCLGLPESVERYTACNEIEKQGFAYIPGLRFPIGWIGCGYSYKFILRKAYDLGMEQVTVCEDDVVFMPDFTARFAVVQDFLHDHTEWDLFSGLIADVHPDTKILTIESYKGLHFITIDRTVSTVFNVYSRKVCSLIQQWSEDNTDLSCNTIDRFIEHIPNLKVVLVLPFLVGHKEELYSTIWCGNKNTVYNDGIVRSAQLLQEKCADWKKVQQA